VREIISWEGEEKLKGVLFEKGSLTWGDRDIPVFWDYDLSRPPLAFASDLKREGDGSVTAEINMTDTEDAKQAGPLIVRGEAGCAILANEIVKTVEDGVQRVSSGSIKAIGVVSRNNLAW
jgi:hypothetical protein